MFAEQLESRLLFASDVTVQLTAKGTLLIMGTPGNDRIVVTRDGSNVRVAANGGEHRFAANLVRRIQCDAGDGDDKVAVKLGFRCTLDGGSGNDTLTGGGGDDSLIGGDGADILSGGGGQNAYDSGPGNNVLIASGGSSPDLPDIVDYHDRPQAIRMDEFELIPKDDFIFQAPFEETAVHIGSETDLLKGHYWGIIGTSKPDKFTISSAGNVSLIHGCGGNDRFSGVSDSNGQLMTTVYGDGGNDHFSRDDDGQFIAVFGGSGNDIFEGGNVVWSGGPGIDTDFYEGSIFDSVDLRSTPDVENIENLTSPVTEVFGNSLNNLIQFVETDANVTVDAGAGNDTVVGGVADNGTGLDISGGLGDDSLTGSNGNDTIHGDEGNDRIIGGPGQDQLFGDAGNDVIDSKDGEKDSVDGGDGMDSATADKGPTVFDTVTHVENIS